MFQRGYTSNFKRNFKGGTLQTYITLHTFVGEVQFRLRIWPSNIKQVRTGHATRPKDLFRHRDGTNSCARSAFPNA